MIEGRVDRLEEAILQHEDRMDGLQEAMMEILKGQAETRALQGIMAEHIEELRRDTQHNQRMWVHLAHKHGWLDDEDLAV